MDKTYSKNIFIGRPLAGFTLIELLVSVFIISLLSGSVLVSSWQSQGQYYASKTAQKMMVDLRRVQNMALSGKVQGVEAPGGYGVYSQSAERYLLFYNSDSSKTYDASSVVLETVDLEKVSLSPVGANVFFVPPDPTTFINGSNNGSQIFTISSADGGTVKNVSAFVSGRIEID